jgi:hypothetical protein
MREADEGTFLFHGVPVNIALEVYLTGGCLAGGCRQWLPEIIYGTA